MHNNRKFGTVLIVGVMLATGCATKTGTGAAVGGGGGALLGGIVGGLAGGKKGAVIGAGVGAATGAGTGALIGRYMDNQEKKLKEVKSAKVERQGDQLSVKFNSAILFKVNKSDLQDQAKADLTEFATTLKEFKETDLVIEGHTDSTGKKATNQTLSQARAEAVVSFLESQGVARSRMKGVGFADERPVADNGTPDGRAANRRVEVQIAANEKLKAEDAQAAAAPPPAK